MGKSAYKYIAEFRYKPLPSVIDKRGDLVQAMISSSLTEWAVSKDRVDVFSSSQTKGAFVSYQNCGFATENKEDLDNLLDTVNRAIKLLPDPTYSRIGLRLTAIIETKKKFDTLLNNFQKKLLKVELITSAPYKPEIKDVSASYVLKIGEDEFNVQIGPMEQAQARIFFPGVENLPKNGVYIDIDCYKHLKPGSTFKDVRRFVHFSKQKSQDLHLHLADIIEGSDGK